MYILFILHLETTSIFWKGLGVASIFTIGWNAVMFAHPIRIAETISIHCQEARTYGNNLCLRGKAGVRKYFFRSGIIGYHKWNWVYTGEICFNNCNMGNCQYWAIWLISKKNIEYFSFLFLFFCDDFLELNFYYRKKQAPCVCHTSRNLL